MGHRPALSVIMPARNAGGTIAQAIRSVLASTFSDFEFIIIDDGSADDTSDRVSAFTDPRIRFHSNPDPGLCHALNLAVSLCRAPLIARMDADDRCYSNRFEIQLRALDRQNWDVVGGLVRILDASGCPVPSLHRYERWVNQHHDDASIRAFRFVESPLANPTTLARCEVYDQPFEDGPFPEDYEFWLQAMNKGYRFGKVPDTVLDWIDTPERTTRNHPRYSPDAFDRCRRKHLLKGPLAQIETVDVWGAGQTGKPWVRWLQSEGLSVRRLIDVSPRKIGQTIHGTRVISPQQLPPPDNVPLIIAVGADRARVQIEPFLRQRDYTIGGNTWFVA